MSWLTALFPGRLYAYLAVVLAVFAAGGASAWQIQQWRFNTKEIAREKQELVNVEFAAKEQFRKQEQVIAASNAAVARENRIRVQLAGTTDLVDGLRSDLRAASLAAATTLETCVAFSDTKSEQLEFCAKRLIYYAEQADLWLSDAIKLDEAWPKN